MSQIEGFVSIGTGGMLNTEVRTASGTVGSGTYWASLPDGFGSATPGAPTGWVGGFSGTYGLLGAGVQAVGRLSPGLYAVQLSDDWTRLDSCQITYVGGSTGAVASGTWADIVWHTVGLGNSQTTGPLGSLHLKNQIIIQFSLDDVASADLPLGSGFFLDIRVRDTLAGPQ